MDGLTPHDFIHSLSLEKNREKVFQAGEGAGSSGSFFFFSSDNRFFIKTLRGPEKDKMLNMLGDYIEHIQATSNQSLLARIYGIFTIKSNYFQPIDIMILQSTVRMGSPLNNKL